jgi:hypothetical protein
MKKLLFILILALVSTLGYAQKAPDISGIWAASNGATLTIVQKGKKVNWVHEDSGFKYVAQGSWFAKQEVFLISVQRTNKVDKCLTHLRVQLTIFSDTKAQFEESAMDGKCDVKIGYRNSYTLTKSN